MKSARTWIFGVTSIPFGASAGFAGITMPFLVRKAGVSVENIGWYSMATLLPAVLQFLWAPVVDLGFRRRTWLVIVSALGAACLWGALLMPLPGSMGAFLGLTVAGQLLTGLVGSCNGGLLAKSIPDELRGRAGGFYNAGNLGGAALAATVTLPLAERFSGNVVGACLALLVFLPSLAALTIPEPGREKRRAKDMFHRTLSDLWNAARSRSGWTGMLFCLSPVGTAALLNFFSAIAVDYHASNDMVAFVNGPVAGLVTAVGAIGGGVICDRMNRRRAYLLSGGLTAVCGALMMLGSLTPTTYAIGATVYLLVSGFCYASFSAVVLEVVGAAGDAASTQYTLFTAAGNFAIMYTGWVDTRFHHLYGPRGLLGVDALANVIGIVLLATMMRFVKIGREEAVSEAA